MHLVVHKLKKRIHKNLSIQGINLEAQQASVTVILGPRGSGKTQFLKLIAGIDVPDSGDIFLQGEKTTSLGVAERETGIVFDHPHFFPHLNMYQNLKLVLKKRPDTSLTTEDIIRQYTDELDFSHLLMSLPSDLTPMQLFIGQLARALLNDPILLLVDDPFEQIDGAHYNQIRLLLKKQANRYGRTLIITTRFADQAQLLANQLVVFDHGQIMQADQPARIYQHPQNLRVANTIYTQGFNVIPARIHRRYKRFIDCMISDRMEVRVHIDGNKIIDYDRDSVYICLPANTCTLTQNAEQSLEVLKARLIATETTALQIYSHWQLDQDTLLEVHTTESPEEAPGSISNIYFSGTDVLVYSEQGQLLSSRL